ncbi:MAG: aminotransferase class I/II-fold pyridoxal phosphate-dependent enzyme [Thermoleophilia bacterium]|nr:aminotransferase class I/II-fold pyridoxal phosphate-dependent enzyme [Thermoleophilia bacterium]
MDPLASGLNSLAVELNNTIRAHAPAVFRLLSELGRALYFPKGILTQTAEAKEKAFKYNATIGEAREDQRAMGLPSITKLVSGLTPDDMLPYAPAAGRADLRKLWKEHIKQSNPSLGEAPISLPVVTTGITHGLSTVADMFFDAGDVLLLPDKLWGNYRMVFGVKRGARLGTYPLLTPDGGFDLDGFRQVVTTQADVGRVSVLFNFPNNPIGYTISQQEAEAIRDILVDAAERYQCDVLAICDDAYFGLFYGDSPFRESLFSLLAGAHPRVLAIKLDGASKEDYAWGLRVGFLTYGIEGGAPVYEALEKKTAGCIRATVSNASNLSQALLVKAMQDPDYQAEREEKYRVLAQRAARALEVLADPKFAQAWTLYPFNSGYFLCVRLHGLDAEQYRVRLLNEYGVGVISTSDTDIRVAISCVEEEDIPDLFDVMLRCALEMKGE